MAELNAKKIFASSIRPSVIGEAGEIVRQTNSTMDIAKELAARGAPDGYILAAESQSAGRGRTGKWDAGEGKSIIASIILRANIRASERMMIGIMGAVASAEALQSAGVSARIKWPNDIVVARRDNDGLKLKKLGGILVEQHSRGDSAPVHIIGIGLNINQSKDQLPADAALSPASVKTQTGKEADRNRICRLLFKRLDRWYKAFCLGKPELLMARWKNLSCLVGERLEVKCKGKLFQVTVLGLSASGKLIVESDTELKSYLSDKDSSILLR